MLVGERTTEKCGTKVRTKKARIDRTRKIYYCLLYPKAAFFSRK